MSNDLELLETRLLAERRDAMAASSVGSSWSSAHWRVVRGLTATLNTKVALDAGLAKRAAMRAAALEAIEALNNMDARFDALREAGRAKSDAQRAALRRLGGIPHKD